MAVFSYKAVDPKGKDHTGVLEAANAAMARSALRERNLLPVSVEATTDRETVAADRDASAPLQSLLSRRRLDGRSLSLVTRQLSTLIGAGVPIEEALAIVGREATKPRTAALMLDLRSQVVEGASLAQALEAHPGSFPEFYRASVAAGEQSGRIGDVLGHLAGFVEARQKNRQAAKLALIYPALLALVSIGIIVALLVYVVPDIVRVFQARGGDLPLLTEGLIAVSGFVSSWGWAVALGVVLLWFGFRAWVAVPANRLAHDRRLLRFPPTRGFVRQANSAQFAGTLATLVNSGVPLVEALETSGKATPNRHMRAKIEEIAARVREGSSFRHAVAGAAIFPPMLTAMIASGEAGRQLGPVLERAAEDQQRELDGMVSTLVSLVEPGVLLLMGGIVMLIVVSILLPIVGLNDLVGGAL